MRLAKKHFAALLATVVLLSLASVSVFTWADDFSVDPDTEVYSQTVIIDAGDTGGNLLLQFGNTSARALSWDNGISRFSFTHPLNIAGNNGSLELGDGTSTDHTIVFDDGEGIDESWAETQPAGASNQAWRNVAISDDGQKMLAAVNGGRLWLSSNGGSSWAEAQPAGASNQAWRPIAVSGDGDTMLVGVDGGRLYMSSNGGGNWSEVQPAGNVNQSWRIGAVSDDGQTMLAGVFGGRLWLSTNGGSSWAETQPAGASNQNWDTIAMNDDGEVMLAGIYAGSLYLSTNGGSSWGEEQPAGAGGQLWGLASMSGDGQTILVPIASARLWLSSNGGSSWAETQPLGATNQLWGTTTVSDDGDTMLALTYGGRIYRSINGGSSWAETQPNGNNNYDWLALGVSGNGLSMLAGVDVGRLYRLAGVENNGRIFGWDDSANAFSTFGTPFGYGIYSTANPPTTCRSSVGGMMFIDTDSGITYVCDTTNGRNQWLSVQEMRLVGDTDPSSNFCTAGGEVGTTTGCTPNWGDDSGAGTSSDMGLFLPYPITVTGYDFSSDYDACLTGSFDVEIWTSTGISDDNNYSLAVALASNLTGETANAIDLAATVDGASYMIWGVDNNCGESLSRWNMTIFYRYRHP